MWISKKEYKKIIDEKQSFEKSAEYRGILYRNFAERNTMLSNENDRLREEIEQLKIKYANEVNKNFELASYLSENQQYKQVF